MSKSKKWTASDIRNQMRVRYQQPEHALFFEVRNSTGFNGNRSADALAMDMYPSRGLAVHGFEIKVSRADFLKELKEGAKAEAIAQYCNHWWLVAPAEVLRGDLPMGWGWLKPTEKGLRIEKAAPAQEAVAIPNTFLASILRSANRASDLVVESAVEKRTASLRDDIDKLAEETAELKRVAIRGDLKEAREAIQQVEELTGFKLNKWGQHKDFFNAVRAVAAVGPDVSYSGARAVMAAAQRTVRDMEKALDQCGFDTDKKRQSA